MYQVMPHPQCGLLTAETPAGEHRLREDGRRVGDTVSSHRGSKQPTGAGSEIVARGVDAAPSKIGPAGAEDLRRGRRRRGGARGGIASVHVENVAPHAASPNYVRSTVAAMLRQLPRPQRSSFPAWSAVALRAAYGDGPIAPA